MHSFQIFRKITPGALEGCFRWWWDGDGQFGWFWGPSSKPRIIPHQRGQRRGRFSLEDPYGPGASSGTGTGSMPLVLPASRKDEMETWEFHVSMSLFFRHQKVPINKPHCPFSPISKGAPRLGSFSALSTPSSAPESLEAAQPDQNQESYKQRMRSVSVGSQSGLKHVQKLHHPRNLPWCIGDPGGLHVGCTRRKPSFTRLLFWRYRRFLQTSMFFL